MITFFEKNVQIELSVYIGCDHLSGMDHCRHSGAGDRALRSGDTGSDGPRFSLRLHSIGLERTTLDAIFSAVLFTAEDIRCWLAA